MKGAQARPQGVQDLYDKVMKNKQAGQGSAPTPETEEKRSSLLGALFKGRGAGIEKKETPKAAGELDVSYEQNFDGDDDAQYDAYEAIMQYREDGTSSGGSVDSTSRSANRISDEDEWEKFDAIAHSISNDMQEMRDAIAAGTFEAWQKKFHEDRAQGDIDPL